MASSACGGGGGISKADYIAKADALCTDVRTKLNAIAPPTTVADHAVYLSRSIPLNEELLRQLRAMTPPAGDEAVISKILSEFDDAVARARVAEKEALTGDPTATDVAEKEIQQSVEKAGTDAKAYGFKACGSGASSDQ